MAVGSQGPVKSGHGLGFPGGKSRAGRATGEVTTGQCLSEGWDHCWQKWCCLGGSSQGPYHHLFLLGTPS